MFAIRGASYKNACDPDNELATPPPGTSTLRSLVPTPTGKMHVMVLNCCTLTPLQDLDKEDNIFDAKETTVLDDDVPKLNPCIVIETPPEVGLPDPDVTLAINGESYLNAVFDKCPVAESPSTLTVGYSMAPTPGRRVHVMSV